MHGGLPLLASKLIYVNLDKRHFIEIEKLRPTEFV